MITPWTKIKAGFALAGVVVIALLYGMVQRLKRKSADEHAAIAETNFETSKKVIDAMTKGSERQKEILSEKIDTDKRNILS